MILDALHVTSLHLASLLGPTLLAALVLHQLNVLTTRALGGTFGASSVIWFTGWLGTPVHELSHAAACLLFRHRIQELVLFRPDPASGVAGYVRYTWSPRNPLALLGHGFVGVAPLFGGALSLAILLSLLLPDDLARSLFRITLTEQATLGDWLVRLQSASHALLRPELWSQPRSWLLAYLALCVGTHTAPSGADLKGAWPSLLLNLVLLAAVDFGLVLFLEDDGTKFVMSASSLMVPVVVMFALAALLAGLALVGVLILATVWSTIRGRGPLSPARMILAEPWRLAIVVAVGILAALLGS